MSATLVSRESLCALLDRKPVETVGRALVALFKAGQTEAERSSNTTNVLNGIGFSGADARSGSITAKYFIKHGTLLEWQVEQWTKVTKNGYPKLCKYVKKINDIAERKQKGN